MRVLIVGAGPSGSALAIRLARAGLEVDLLDRRAHPRPKPCGELINPGAVEELRALGVVDDVRALEPATIEGWRLYTPGAAMAVGRYAHDRRGLSVPRAHLDRVLAEAAAKAGAPLHVGVQVRAVRPTPAGLPVAETIEPDGRRGLREADLVVGADGLRSLVARAVDPSRSTGTLRKVSLTAHVSGRMPDHGTGALLFDDEGTIGLAPVDAEGSSWNVTVVLDSAASGSEVRAHPRLVVERRLERTAGLWSEPPRVVEGPWASGPFDRPAARVVADGMLLIGDAAGYYDPLTGQGVFRALQSARLAADVVLCLDDQGGRPTTSALSPYERRLRGTRRASRLVQRAVEWVVSGPHRRHHVIERLSRSPGAVDRLVRFTGDAAPLMSLLHPGLVWPLARGVLSAGVRPLFTARGGPELPESPEVEPTRRSAAR